MATSNPLLIGICGALGSGKDSTFDAIWGYADAHEKQAVRRAFADKLKLSAYRIFKPDASLDEARDWADQIKRDDGEYGRYEYREVHTWAPDINYSITGRQFLQRYGTEAHRDVFGHDFWVDALLPFGDGPWGAIQWWSNFAPYEGAGADQMPDYCVITDVRFENEAKRIKDLGGKLWEIKRPGTATDGHVSEAGIDSKYIDLRIHNTGTLEDLSIAVSQALNMTHV